MQKKIITTICFVALAAVLIGAGVWYDTKAEQADQEAQAQAGIAAIRGAECGATGYYAKF